MNMACLPWALKTSSLPVNFLPKSFVSVFSNTKKELKVKESQLCDAHTVDYEAVICILFYR